MRSRDMDVGVWFDDMRAEEAYYWLYFTRVWYFARVWTGYQEITAADGWDGHVVEIVPPRRRPPAGFDGGEIHHYLFELEGHGLFELLAEDWCSSLTDPDAAVEPDIGAEGDLADRADRPPGTAAGADLDPTQLAAVTIGSQP
jgi:hypothetical protein